MQQLLLDESGKWHYTGKDKAKRLPITLETIESEALPRSLLLEESKIPRSVIYFVIPINKESSLEVDIYMDFNKLSKKDAKDFCKEVIKIWKESLRRGSMISILHIEKTCKKKFKSFHFRIFHFERVSNGLKGFTNTIIRYLDLKPTIVGTQDRTYHAPVLSTHTIPVPFSAKHRRSSSCFD